MNARTRVLLRRIVRLIGIALVAGVIANDVYQVVPAFTASGEAVNAAMAAAISAASAAPDTPDSGRQAAIQAAAAQGATVESYSQQLGVAASNRTVLLTVSVSSPVHNTVVAAPVLGLMNGVAPAQWYAPAGAKITVTQTKSVAVY